MIVICKLAVIKNEGKKIDFIISCFNEQFYYNQHHDNGGHVCVTVCECMREGSS